MENDVIIKISEDMNETVFLSYYPANEKHILDNMVAEPSMKFTGEEFKDFTKD